MGCHVSFASDGQEAIDEYDAALFDVVVADLTLPGGIGGEKVAEEILAINPEAKIIVSSGYANSSIMANYKAYGYQGRIVKPYSFAELQKVLEQVFKE